MRSLGRFYETVADASLGLAVATYSFESLHSIHGFGMGASTVALFSRVGGGIFTKSADIGSDLVGKIEKGIYNLFITTPDGQEVNTRLSVPSSGSIHMRAKLYPEDGPKKSSIYLVPPLWNQWYFWASIGGTVALTGVSSYAIYQANQPIPAPNGDISVSIP